MTYILVQFLQIKTHVPSINLLAQSTGEDVNPFHIFYFYSVLEFDYEDRLRKYIAHEQSEKDKKMQLFVKNIEDVTDTFFQCIRQRFWDFRIEYILTQILYMKASTSQRNCSLKLKTNHKSQQWIKESIEINDEIKLIIFYILIQSYIIISLSHHKIMSSLYLTDAFNPDFPQLKVISTLLSTNLQVHYIPAKYSPMTLVDDGIVLTQPISICYHLSLQSDRYKLLGSTFETEVQVYSWIQYFNLQLKPLITQISAQVFGKVQPNIQKYNYATEQLKRVLKVIDEKLKFRTFLVGDSLTLADVVFCSQLDHLFRLTITPDIRRKNINLTRWFTFVRNLHPFVHSLGKIFLCQHPFKIEVDSQTEKQENSVTQHSEKKEKKPEQKVKKQKKNNQKQEKPIQKNEQKHEKKVDEKPEQKQGQFNLDNFKRAFQNTEDKSSVIDKMLTEINEGWSIWKIDYSKDVTEGKVDYLTCNLAKGTLQRLDGLRKTGFGSWGVYFSQQTKEYEIRGVMLWKGSDVATAWKEHPSHQYHIFTKLNPNDPEHIKLIKDYWLQNEKSEGLQLHASYRLI